VRGGAAQAPRLTVVPAEDRVGRAVGGRVGGGGGLQVMNLK
jgi:hypothetical protein